jgi:hypothetical protein
MSRWEGGSPWIATVSTHLPALSRTQAWVLALWSCGMVLGQSGGTATVAALLALLLGQREDALRHRLREWCYDAADKRGDKRRAVAVEACFAPLLGWVLAWWPAMARRLALDATPLGQRFTVLTLSVVVRADRSLYARWLYQAMQANGWHPFLLINAQGTYHPATGGPSGCWPASLRWSVAPPGVGTWCASRAATAGSPAPCWRAGRLGSESAGWS